MTPFGFGLRFYLGLGAPASRRRYPECTVRAAQGYAPDLVRALLHIYLGDAEPGVGVMERINHRSGVITLTESGDKFFFKEFPRHHRGHDLERMLRLSRVDRAWRAAHLLPGLHLDTPPAIGTAQRRQANGVTEYLATRWLEDAVQFPKRLPPTGELRTAMLQEFTLCMRAGHTQGLYTRDFVKNVLVQTEGDARRYWLIDLDGVHPLRRVTRRRILFHMKQLAHYCPLTLEEAHLVCNAYLGTTEGKWAQAVLTALQSR